uniref:Uncharacterized protein n=1 Tax=Candidatus Kentrum sp. FW TaxID=2126338 RepID=A0A450SH90_9GAMM|nr:MAG: hypothetical protein BECKFW1821B_GA0114236_101232 [Candidatus Kentron sp. FW]
MADIQQTLGLSKEEAEEIRERVRKEWDTCSHTGDRSHAGAWERGEPTMGVARALRGEFPDRPPAADGVSGASPDKPPADKPISPSPQTRKPTRVALPLTIASLAVIGVGSWYYVSKESHHPPVASISDAGGSRLARSTPATQPLVTTIPLSQQGLLGFSARDGKNRQTSAQPIVRSNVSGDTVTIDGKPMDSTPMPIP